MNKTDVIFPFYKTNGDEIFCFVDKNTILGVRSFATSEHSDELTIYYGPAAFETIMRHPDCTKEDFEKEVGLAWSKIKKAFGS